MLLRTVCVGLSLPALLLAAAAGAGPPETVRITIVHTNDLHGCIENAPTIAAVARAVRKENPNTLFLDAGDCITGTPVSTMFKGEPVFEVMSLMGYDAGTLGNHEFDHGWRQIRRFRELAAHPLLNANAADPEGAPLGDEASHVFDVGGARVGVLGLLTGDMPSLAMRADWAGCRVEPPLETAKRLVPELRARCDVVVLLTHVGAEVDAAIAGAVPGIDLIVGGHDHEKFLPLPVKSADRTVAVAHTSRNGALVGVVDLEWNRASRSVRVVDGRLVTIDAKTMPGAPDVKRLVDQWLRRVGEKVDLRETIGTARERIGRERLRAAIERIYADALGADFGFQNMRGVRSEIAAGEIRVEDVWRALPFDDVLVKLRVKGSLLPAFARDALAGRLDPEKEYVIATRAFVGEQQGKYLGVSGRPVEKTELSMRDVVVAWVRKHGGFDVAGLRDRPADGEGDDR